MKNSFAPIFTSMLDSSVWMEPYTVRVLWTALLALKESDHIVRFTAFQLARRANMTEQEVIDALKILESPDTRRLEPQPFDGRRIEKVDGGWMILNGQKYEDQMRLISRRAYNARKQREYRRAKNQSSGPITGETAAVRMESTGASQGEIDRHITNSLPPESLPPDLPPDPPPNDPEGLYSELT